MMLRSGGTEKGLRVFLSAFLRVDFLSRAAVLEKNYKA